jgi:hypothetical protein
MECCPNFHGGSKVGLIRSHINESYSLPFETIKILRRGIGELKRCTACNTAWFIQPNEIYVELINPKLLKSILLWEKKDLSIKQDFFDILTKIGHTPFLLNGIVSKEHICIPCKCTLINRRVIDHCIINIPKKHLYIKNNTKTFYSSIRLPK